MPAPEARGIRAGVTEKYRKVSASAEGLFRYPTGEGSAVGLGYTAELIAAVPPAVRDRFVGVGNPFALGPIHPNERVLDLGCGAGFDALVAARLVGLRGRVMGVDLSAEMLAVAEAGRADGRFVRVAYQRADVESLPFTDEAFDAVLSNGVLNLVADKPAALREIFRVLRPGGRLQACDMGLVGEAPPADKALWSD
jgi:SAM-dependent methyltransferase